MPNFLIKLKVQMLHSVTPLIQGATVNIKPVSAPGLTYQYGVLRYDVALYTERKVPDLWGVVLKMRQDLFPSTLTSFVLSSLLHTCFQMSRDSTSVVC